MRSLVLSTARPVAAVVATLLVAPPAFARTIRCESRNFRYSYCRVDTHGDVRLDRELSSASCRYGRGWGYDHRGIWVDRGCRAEFVVNEGHRGRYTGYDYYDDRDRGPSKTETAVAGVALGAAVAAAIVANKKKHADDTDDAPNWLVGRFVGYNQQYKSEVALQISPSGNVTGYLPGGEVVGGHYHGGRVSIGGTEFDLDRQGSGFTLVERGNSDNVVLYRRDR